MEANTLQLAKIKANLERSRNRLEQIRDRLDSLERLSTPVTKMVEVPFFILFPERSGSSLLVDLINSHPDVKCQSEIFHLNRDKNGRWHRLERYPHRTAVRQKLVDVYAPSKTYKASGFKFHYPRQIQAYPEVYEYFLQMPDRFRIIHLRRDNLLKAAISQQNVIRLVNLTNKHNLERQMSVKLDPLTLNIDRAIQYMNQRQENVRAYSKLTEVFKYRLELNYESILSNRADLMKQVFEFLNVNSNVEASSKYVKITPDSLEESISNYAQLCQRLKNTEYEKYLFM